MSTKYSLCDYTKLSFNKVSLILTLLLYFSIANSQDGDKVDSTFIKKYTDKITIKANLNTQADIYSIKRNNNSSFNLVTNNQYRFNISLDYEFLGGNIGFSPKFLPGNNDDDLKGKSSFTNYNFRFYLGNWIQDLQYRKVEGFYLDNTADITPNWLAGRDPYIQFPDLKTVFWGGSTSYLLNPNFSLRHISSNIERQLKSAGSFIPTVHYGYTRISGNVDDIQSYEDIYDLSIAVDYYHTFVFRSKWFISPFLSPSFGTRFSKEGEVNSEIAFKNTYFPLRLEGGLQLGYSSEKIFFGTNFNFDSSWYKQDNSTNVLNDKAFAKVYFGIRLTPPKFVKKYTDWMSKIK